MQRTSISPQSDMFGREPNHPNPPESAKKGTFSKNSKKISLSIFKKKMIAKFNASIDFFLKF